MAAEADTVISVEGSRGALAEWSRRSSSVGVEGAGHVIKGSQGTWEILSSPPERNRGVGLPKYEVLVVRSGALVTAR